MNISIELIESSFQRILKSLRERNPADAPPEEDYYWNVPNNEEYNMKQEPELTVGSLFDDVSGLTNLVSDPDIPVTSVDMNRLAAIIRYLGAMQDRA